MLRGPRQFNSIVSCTMASSTTASISKPLEWAQRVGVRYGQQCHGKYQYDSSVGTTSGHAMMVAIRQQVSVCLLSGHSEWACNMGSNAMASISMRLEWDFLSTHGMCCQAMLNLWQVSISLLAAQERELSRAHSSGEATCAFIKGMEQPQAESLLKCKTENCSEPHRWHAHAIPWQVSVIR